MLRVELLRDCFLLEEASRLKMNLGGWILPVAGVIAVAFLADSDVGYGTGGSGSGISSPGTCGSESIPNGQRASLPHRRPVGRPCIRSSLSSGQMLQERQQLQKNPRLGHRQGPTPRQQSQPRTAEQRGRPLAHQRVRICWGQHPSPAQQVNASHQQNISISCQGWQALLFTFLGSPGFWASPQTDVCGPERHQWSTTSVHRLSHLKIK